MKATIVKSAAGLTHTQIENLNTIVDLGSDQTDLEEKTKHALRRITIKPSGTKVYMMDQEEYEVYEGYEYNEGCDEAQQHQPDDARLLIKEIKSTQMETKYSRLGNLNDLYLEVYAL